MNLGDVAATTVPKLTLVAAPREGGTIATRTFIPHRCHEAIGVLGAVSVATAALVARGPGGRGRGARHRRRRGRDHRAPHRDVRRRRRPGAGGRLPVVERAGIIRTARKLMDGTVFPREP